jgi:hypothetical protein
MRTEISDDARRAASTVTILRSVGLALALLIGLGTAFGTAIGRQEDPFPHEDHEGLFPVCSGCHQGIADGDVADFYPDPLQCAGCHDGREEERVGWIGPSERTTNVIFDHREHAAQLIAAGDSAQSCEACHSGPAGRMSVDEVEEVETCWSCHDHERDSHYETAETFTCDPCHVPLARSGFDRSRIEALPVPAEHEGPDFLLDRHGDEVEQDPTRCSTCHTSDRCASCHVVADREEITQIPPAPPGMTQPVWDAEYPVPASHEPRDWSTDHAVTASGQGECATCHTSNDCLSCHVARVPEVIALFPDREAVAAPGAGLEERAPETHESLFFMAAHSSLAAADAGTCATCHTESSCVACHDGPANGGYHPPNFVARHSADAFARAEECATCHSTAAFCRACHEGGGLGGSARLGPGYHDAEPIWLLRHGQPARQNLESCASCHQQSDCVQCHGDLGAFQVSPHRPGFDARAAWLRSPRTCLACHTSNPVGGG